jgi:hypothetical protein
LQCSKKQNQVMCTSGLYEFIFMKFELPLKKDEYRSLFSEVNDKLKMLIGTRCHNMQELYAPQDGCIYIPSTEDPNGFIEIACSPEERIDINENRLYAAAMGVMNACYIFPSPNFYWSAMARSIITHTTISNKFRLREMISLPSAHIRGDKRDSNFPRVSFQEPYILLSFLEIDRFKVIKTLHELKKINCPEKESTQYFFTFSRLFPLLIKKEFNEYSALKDHINALMAITNIKSLSSVVLLNPEVATPNTASPIPFRLSIKVKKEFWPHVNQFENLLKTENHQFEVDHFYLRTGYWDFEAFLSTNNLGIAHETIIKKFNETPSIEDFILLPHWIVNKTDQIPIEREETKTNWKDEKGNMCSLSSIVPISPNKFILDFSNDTIKNLYKQWEVMSQMLYESKFEIDWIYNNIYQLKNMWNIHLGTMGSHTFRFLEKSAFKNMENLILLIQIYHIWIKKPLEETKEKLEERKEESFKLIWHPLKSIGEINTTLRYILILLTNEYQIRMEGQRLAQMTFPMASTAERSGISDLILSSYHRLAEDYFPSLKVMPLKEGNTNLNRKLNNFFDFFRWKGIVTAQAPVPEENELKNFYIDTNFEILFIPPEVKLQPMDKFLPLCHEIGHLIIGKIFTVTWSPYRLIYHPVFDEGIEKENDICIDLWGYILKIKNLILQMTKLNETFENKKMEKKIKNININVEEITADVLGFFLGGPLFFITFSNFCYIPNLSNQKNINISYHSCNWLRIKVGLSLCNKFNLSNNWKAPLENEIARIEASESKEYLKKAKQAWRILEQCDNNKFFEEIKNWLYDNFEEESLFFPSLIKSEEIFNRCKNISQRLAFSGEIVDDEKPKYVAAASLLQPLKRPFFPSGQLFLSLYYTKNNQSRSLAK